MNIDALSKVLIPTGERFQLVQTKGSSVIKVACGYRYPSHIREIVEQAASKVGVEVDLQSHLSGIPMSAISKIISINGYTKFTW
jgi:acetone carboxylase gamma subunit